MKSQDLTQPLQDKDTVIQPFDQEDDPMYCIFFDTVEMEDSPI